MPDEIAVPFRPMAGGMDDGFMSTVNFTNTKAHRLLGYKDVVKLRDAISITAKWQVANQDKVAASAAIALEDPLDYENEDKLLAVGGFDGKVRLIDAQKGTLRKVFVPVPLEAKTETRTF